MDLDLPLAVFHHVAVVTLVVLLGIEIALLRPGLSAEDIRRLAAFDIAYGITAGIVVVVGVCRVIWGVKRSRLLSWERLVLGKDGKFCRDRASLDTANLGAAKVEKDVAERWLLCPLRC